MQAEVAIANSINKCAESTNKSLQTEHKNYENVFHVLNKNPLTERRKFTRFFQELETAVITR
jgi:hypothetical protein